MKLVRWASSAFCGRPSDADPLTQTVIDGECHGQYNGDRVDRGDLEPGDGLHQGQPRVQALLRRADGTRLTGDGERATTSDGFELTLHGHLLDVPLRWRKPRHIFVNSMSDLFHEDVPRGVHRSGSSTSWRGAAGTRSRCSRSGRERLAEPAPRRLRLAGERLDGRQRRERASTPTASTTCARTGPQSGSSRSSRCSARLLDLDLGGIDWVIVGGESGPGAGRCSEEWVRDIRDQCRPAGVSVLLQAVGRPEQGATGRVLDGRTYDAMPPREQQTVRQSQVGAGD